MQITTDIVAAYVAYNSMPSAELPALIAATYAALASITRPGTPTAARTLEKVTPAQIRRSITHEALISFEDGKPYRTLKRNLSLHGLTPEAYRDKWGLPSDYPMTAPGYSATRSALAKGIGLGHVHRGGVEAAPAPEPIVEAATAKPKRGGKARKVKERAAA